MTNNLSENSQQNKTWKYPWNFIESFSIAAAVFLIGIGLEYFSTSSIAIFFVWPINGILALLFVSTIVLLQLSLKKKPFIIWLSSTPAAISALSLFAIVALMLGLIPQIPQTGKTPDGFIFQFGFTHIINSWYFILAQVYFLTILGFVTIRRLFPFSAKNLFFFLNHGGLFIALTIALIGSSDLQRHQMQLFLNQPIWYGIDKNEKEHEFDFSLTLLKFDIEEYEPTLVIVDNNSGLVIGKNGSNSIIIKNDNSGTIEKWEIEIDTFYQSAGRIGNLYRSVHDVGAAPAALITVKNTTTQVKKSGWISCGSFRMQFESLKLDSNYSVAMVEPKPKKFLSTALLQTKQGSTDTVQIAVNEPVSVNGWKLYQVSYDEKMGKWSHISIIEAVKDPWLPFVYIGIFMMIAGALVIFILGDTFGRKVS